MHLISANRSLLRPLYCTHKLPLVLIQCWNTLYYYKQTLCSNSPRLLVSRLFFVFVISVDFNHQMYNFAFISHDCVEWHSLLIVITLLLWRMWASCTMYEHHFVRRGNDTVNSPTHFKPCYCHVITSQLSLL